MLYDKHNHAESSMRKSNMHIAYRVFACLILHFCAYESVDLNISYCLPYDEFREFSCIDSAVQIISILFSHLCFMKS